MPARLLLVDNHDVLRMGLHSLFTVRQGWQVCGEAEHGEDAVPKVRELSPYAVILDLLAPGMTGFEVVSRIEEIGPSTKIIFFSLHNVPITARESGADVFVSKASRALELFPAIDGVMRSLGETPPPLSVTE